MSRTFIQQAKIIAPGHNLHLKKADILIENGKISKIASKLDIKADSTISGKDLHVSLGWIDFRAQFCDPGEEYKEDLNSGTAAASRGGFTGVAVLPPETVQRDNKAGILYIKNNSPSNGVELYPYGNISVSSKGENLSEIYDMLQSGAALFTDNLTDINSGLLKRALLYTKDLDTLVTVIPFEHQLVRAGQMHEGNVSTRNGLKAWPDLTETIRIERDLNILRYTEGKLHFSMISSAAGLELIKSAKKEGLNVTCDIAAHQLTYTEEDLKDFDTTFKVCPPFRGETDRKALIKAVKEGIVDIVCSDHNPQDTEHKEMEFEHADFGIAGIMNVFHHLMKAGIPVETAIDKISTQPRKMLNIQHEFAVGSQANLTIFDPSVKEKFTTNKPSKSQYNPMITKEVQGKVIATILGNQINIH